jgi:UDP-MurNAc hydroxylase
MRVTFLGHAGMYVETRYGSILSDPWFNPAYFASWFPFPSNDAIDLAHIAHPTYLYVSHLHHDHFDPQFLRDHVSKETTVILPDYPIDALERALRELGFTRFLHTKNGEAVEVDGLRLMVVALVAPVDGPLGDSGLLIDDGETRIYDQNDSRPIAFDRIRGFGALDAHFLQFSGAIWYPMVYQYPAQMRQALGRKKRENGQARALRYVQECGATFVVPSAGPPCFLDDDLFHLNDFDRDSTNTFPDQTVFLEYLRAHGVANSQLMIPGSVATITPGRFDLAHPMADEEVARIFTEKRGYLEAYKARKQPLIDGIKASWPHGQVDTLSALREWFEPLLALADLTCVGINGRLLLDCDTDAIVIDFHERTVYRWAGEEWEYRFHIAAPLVEDCILRHTVDWVNEIFLSCRFEAERKGAYNEHVYNFFKCLSPERIEYLEGYYAEKDPEQQMWETHGYRLQRRCPHLKADLSRFAQIEDGILTCTLHGWQFELETGRCLTSDGRRLFAQKIEAHPDAAASAGDLAHERETAPTSGATVLDKCHECWYHPSDVAPADVAPADVAPADVAPADVAPADVAPADDAARTGRKR